MGLETQGVRLVIEGLNEFLSGMRGASQQTGKFDQASESLGSSWTELNSILEIGRKALGYAKEAYDAVVVSTLEYGTTVRELGRTIGATAEQASMLIEAADDMGVSSTALQTAMEGAIRKGYTPTIDGLARIADEYNSLPSQIQRTAYAMDIFGRSGADMIPLLERGSEGIRQLGEEARKTGKVLTDVELRNMRQYEEAVDDLGDKWEGFKVRVGNSAIPTLTRVVEQTNKYYDAVGRGDNMLAAQFEWWRAVITGAGDAAVAVEGSALATDEAAVASAELTMELWKQYAQVNALPQAHEAYIRNLQLTAAAEQQARKDALLLSAAVGGQLASANDSWADKTVDLTEKQKDLQAQIAKLEKNNHRTITVNRQVTATQLDLANATFDAETAAAKYAAAQDALNKNTDPNKTRALQGAMLDAGVAMEGAQRKLGDVTEATNGSTTAYVNNDKALKDLYGDLGEVNIALAENAKAHEEAAGRIIYAYTQQAMAQLGVNDPQLMLEMARATGVLSQADYDLQLRILGYTQALKDGQITHEQFLALLRDERDTTALGLTPALRDAALAAQAVVAAMANMPAGMSGQDYATVYNAAHRAGGGPVSGGRPYWVGERGPELVVPRSSGYVVSSSTGPFYTTVNAPGSSPGSVATATGLGIRRGLRARGIMQ